MLEQADGYVHWDMTDEDDGAGPYVRVQFTERWAFERFIDSPKDFIGKPDDKHYILKIGDINYSDMIVYVVDVLPYQTWWDSQQTTGE